MRALDDLVSAGKVLYVGVSEWDADQLEEARALGDRLLLRPIRSNQPQYSLLWRHIESDVVPLSERLGMGQIVWSPLAQGVLTGKYRPGEATPRDSRAAHPDPQTSQFVRLFMRDDILQAVERLNGDRAGAGHHHRAAGHRLGAAPAQRGERDRRRVAARAGRRQRRGQRRRAPARRAAAHRRGAQWCAAAGAAGRLTAVAKPPTGLASRTRSWIFDAARSVHDADERASSVAARTRTQP